MQKILRYKQFDFTLEEIQLLFFMEERDKLLKSIEDIERDIQNLPTSAKTESPPSGVPFHS